MMAILLDLVLDKRHSHALDQWHAANSENSQVRESCGCGVSEAAGRRAGKKRLDKSCAWFGEQ